MYIAIDPGEGIRKPSIGVAVFSNTGELILAHQFYMQGFVDWLEHVSDSDGDVTIDHIIFEEYRVRKNKAMAHVGSRLPTPETIGYIKTFCYRKGIPWTAQRDVDVLGPAQKLFQIKMPSNHDNSHSVSAELHGRYWLWQNGIIKTALETEYAKR